LWWVKSRRAQNDQDYETWLGGGVVPTLNQFDNGDTRATVIIFQAHQSGEVRVQGETSHTLSAFMGTGGNNTPMVIYPINDGKEMEKNQNGSGIGEAGAPSYTLDRSQHASVAMPPATVRRLTPTECERLQGFPDGWTAERIDETKGLIPQADSHRYKQMGNAVAVPVVEWIVDRLVTYENND